SARWRRRSPIRGRLAVALSRIDRVLDMVTSAKALVVDTETTGVDPLADRLVGWVFATEGESHYVPVAHTGGGNRFDDPAPWHRALRPARRALRHQADSRPLQHAILPLAPRLRPRRPGLRQV